MPGSGASLTGVAKLGANAFTGTQTIAAGNLDLGTSTATTGNITKAGVPFLHEFGVRNVFLGKGAGSFTAGAFDNTAVGDEALHSNAGGDQNSAYGAKALTSNTTGYNNVAMGYLALYHNQEECCNTAVGESALFGKTIGYNNVAIGSRAGDSLIQGSSNIYLGANTGGASVESNAIYLGSQGTQTKTVIAGIRGITTGAANAIPVVIDSNGQLGTVSSSIRFKEDIRDMADVSRRLMMLRPVTFRYTQAYRDGAKPIQYGLIAEEVADVFPELAVRGADGQVETVHYETLNVLLLNEFQKQEGRLEALEQQLNELKAGR